MEMEKVEFEGMALTVEDNNLLMGNPMTEEEVEDFYREANGLPCKVVSYHADDNGMFVCWNGQRLTCKFEPMTMGIYAHIAHLGEMKARHPGLYNRLIRVVQKFYLARGPKTALKLKHFEDTIDWQ